ncbi:uncharacterized protein LOC111701611 [Eurytemora carolleeae]|uniref:uncharacterized protein LOC111701611 n=1 Tax=Eurytemora carolleeae TaxID=1294199 RepID=UPI000C7861E6|nr:uncharacterized protein LOC111701611 [Eurytemora carolleeae]|eukprot:XP_023328743.1 uncharacterized protein LOC111701611 [Eurytemora affinis]
MVLQTSKYILLFSLASFSQAKTVQLTNLAPKPGVYLPNLARSLEYTNFGHDEGTPPRSSRQKRFTSFRYRPELLENLAMISNGHNMLDRIRGIVGDKAVDQERDQGTVLREKMKDLIKLKREQALRENDDVHSADSQDEAEAYVANLLRMRGVNLSGASRDILRAPEQSGRNLLRTPDMSYLSLKADSIPRKMNEGSLTPRLRTNEEMLQSLRYHHAKDKFDGVSEYQPIGI